MWLAFVPSIVPENYAHSSSQTLDETTLHSHIGIPKEGEFHKGKMELNRLWVKYRKKEPLKKVQNNKIANVAGWVWLSMFMDDSVMWKLPSTPTSRSSENSFTVKLHYVLWQIACRISYLNTCIFYFKFSLFL